MNPFEIVTDTLVNLKEKEQAKSLVSTLLKHAARLEEYDIVGKLASKHKFFDIQLESCRKSRHLIPPGTPEQYAWLSNIISASLRSNMPQQALTFIEIQEQMREHDLERAMEKSYAYFLSNQKDKAEEVLLSIQQDPFITPKIRADIEFNLATYDLLKGRFKIGLHRFLSGYSGMNKQKTPNIALEPYTHQELDGLHLLILGDGGIGDEIINVRFMTHLRNRGCIPTWHTERKDLAEVFNQAGFDTVSKIDVSKYDAYVTGMKLPLILDLNTEDLWYGPYLPAAPDENRNKLPNIGLRWSGSPEYEQDLFRTVPCQKLRRGLDGIGPLYSLQNDYPWESWMRRNLDDVDSYPLLDGSHLTDWHKTRELMRHLDVVVSSCTSVAHMSAAMGIRTIVLVPISAYYVWCHPSEQSPWYGKHVTIIRQQEPGKWDNEIQQAREIIIKEFVN